MDQVKGQVEAYNRILKEEGMAGLKSRIRAFDPNVESAGRLYVKKLGSPGKQKAWLHEPDMKAGGLPTDVIRSGDRRTNSIIGGQADRISKDILNMDDDVTEIWWSIGLE